MTDEQTTFRVGLFQLGLVMVILCGSSYVVTFILSLIFRLGGTFLRVLEVIGAVGIAFMIISAILFVISLFKKKVKKQ